MKLSKYFKDKLGLILIYFFNYFIIISLLIAFKSSISLISSISLLGLINFLLIFFLSYFKKKIFYDNLLNNLELLDKKYLILETLSKPSFYEGELLFNILYDINKSMIENVNFYKNSVADFKDYVEMWIHEVKIPISSLVLMMHNKKNIDKRFIQEIRKLDNYIDQVLFYVRSNYTEQDFLFKKVSLNKIISQVAIKNIDDLRLNKVNLDVLVSDIVITTDPKWLEFIINQIVNNSIKYKKKSNSYIKIYSKNYQDRVSLFIEDNGIGIPRKDLGSVFNKSFTGENGRNTTKSTGMGLYIAKKLCMKLGHKIEINSCEGEGTTLIITFNLDNFYQIEN